MKQTLDHIESFLSKLRKQLAPYFSPAVVSVLIVFFAAVLLLFLPHYTGIADNGTFSKMIYDSGLYTLKGYDQSYTNYFVREFGILEYFNETGIHWISSQSIFVNLAVFLNKIFYSSTVFDIRFLAAIYLVSYLGGIYLLTKALTIKDRKKSSYIIAVLIGFIFSDSAYLAYFNSFYPNAVVLISYIYMFAAGILFYRKMYSDKVLMLLYVSSAFFLMTSSSQYLFVVAFSVIILAIIGFMNTKLSTRLFALFSVLFILISGVLSYVFIPTSESENNRFQAVSQGSLIVTDKPDEAIAKNGVNPQYGLIKGDNYFDEYLPFNMKSEDVQNNLVKRTNSLWLMNYYVARPKELGKALSKSMETIYYVQDQSLGNFEKSAGRAPGTKTKVLSIYGEMRQKFFPKTLGFLNLFLLVMILLYVPGFIKSVQQKDIREGLRFMMVLVFSIMALLSLIVVTMTFGFNGISPHLMLVPMTLDLLLLLTAAEIFNNRLFKTKQEVMALKEEDVVHE